MFDRLFSPRVSPLPFQHARHFESATTDRLNSGHWAHAHGQGVNDKIGLGLDVLRKRSEYEADNNGLVRGVIETYTADLIDKNGPVLAVQSDNTKYNTSLEDLWREWWAAPDVNGVLPGVDMLALWIQSLWTAGEFLALLTNQTKAPGVQLRLQVLHPSRLMTPYDKVSDMTIVMGVKRTKTGKPSAYYIADDGPDGFDMESRTIHAVSAKNILHGFKITTPDQARGVPWLSGVLQTCADVRDYDQQVLDAARMAADWAGFLVCKDPATDAPVITSGSSWEVERRQINTMPPGWTVEQMDPRQPSAQYVDFRHERLRDVGLPVCMPLMTVIHDASGHNYSSARLDRQAYQRALAGVQGWLERLALNRLVGLVAREGQLKGVGAPPAKVRYTWTWPVAPHVDPQKESTAEKTRLTSGTLSPSAALAAHGIDFDAHVAAMATEWKALEAAGVTPPWEKPAPVVAAPQPPAGKGKPNA